MKVYQIRIKLYLLKDIDLDDCQTELTRFIDSIFGISKELLAFHKANRFKFYTYDMLYPCAINRQYQKDRIYTCTIRTTEPTLAKLFSEKLVNQYNDYFKALTSEIKILSPAFIEKLYSITPCVIKTEQGYWRESMNLSQYQERIKVNLIKKYNQMNQVKLDENFDLFTGIKLLNRKPYALKYKDITLLGDKLELTICKNPTAQTLARMALGTSIGELGSRGCGFVNYKME